MVGIYKIENLINSKVYIGQSRYIEDRWNKHKSKPFNSKDTFYNSPFYRAIRKYGLENFCFSIIECCDTNELNEKEIYWIKYYKSCDKKYGYNINSGGNSGNEIKLKSNDIKSIINLLINTKLSQSEIADIFNVTQRTVSGINSGSTRIEDNVEYPIRKYRCNVNIKTNYCIDCNKIINTQSIRCFSCNCVHLRVCDRPTKEEIEIGIINSNLESVGKKYNVSGNTIKKWCKYYNIQIEHKEKQIKKLRSKIKISQYSMNNEFIQSFESSIDAIKSIKDDKSKSNKYYSNLSGHIRDAANGKRETAYGYIWKIE